MERIDQLDEARILERRRAGVPLVGARREGQPYRLSTGGRIDRSHAITFEFNGRRYRGYQGDTLASALLANGVRLVARSFKYHRARGVVGIGAEEPNAIVQVGRGARALPDRKATQTELYAGLEANSVTAWPRLELDLRAAHGLLARFLPAGFFYKTFMWPRRLWPIYEHYLRVSAGLGYAPDAADPDIYARRNAHCDVLIAGAGPAGLAAALAAGRAGARVILADEQNELGGSLLAGVEHVDGYPAAEWLQRTVTELQAMPEVTLRVRTTVAGYYDHNFLTLAERLTDHVPPEQARGPRERLWRVRARQVVLATGAVERPIVFQNNDRPGVMLARSAATYVNRYAVAPGRRALVVTNNDSAYDSAVSLRSAGIEVPTVIDARQTPHGPAVERVRALGIDILSGMTVTDVRGRGAVCGATVSRMRDDEPCERWNEIDCDLIAVSGGWNPSVQLHSQSGGRIAYDALRACHVPVEAAQPQRSAGACNACFTLDGAFEEGFAAGVEAARAAGLVADPGARPRAATEPPASAPRALWRALPPRHVGRKAFVDFQNDTTVADIELAARENYRSIEHVKRYTALGLGTDQGRMGNLNGAAILARALGQEITATGTTTFRPPCTPVTFGAFAGRYVDELYDPLRKTAMHQQHVAQDAVFEDVGQWKRPRYYPRPGEGMDEAVARECLAARHGVAVMDGSTLGKIDIQGPDAAELLDRVYVNNWKSLGVDRCRYGLMLNEDGTVLDDGVTARLGDDHFHMTTTTPGAARVLGWLEQWLQTEWTDLRVHLTSCTDHWAVIQLVGPHSRQVLTALTDDIDCSAEAFRFMDLRHGTVAGAPARVFRISFSGELTYEINVPANRAMHVWERVLATGKPFGITPYGTETMHVLRAEKGFIIVGQDTDGSVTPLDLGMAGLLSSKKDFLGKRSLSLPECAQSDRQQLVGLVTHQPQRVLPEGAQLVDDPRRAAPVPMCGRVTSSYYSACLGHSIAFALVRRGRERKGETVHAPLADGTVIAATITDSVFYDPKGERQHV